jgi:protein-S-isoprenylcysteine O-methyltransferase Ste14
MEQIVLLWPGWFGLMLGVLAAVCRVLAWRQMLCRRRRASGNGAR